MRFIMSLRVVTDAKVFMKCSSLSINRPKSIRSILIDETPDMTDVYSARTYGTI